MNRLSETRLRKLESVSNTPEKGGNIVAYDQAEADRKLAQARANGLREPMIVITGVPRR